MNNRRLAQIFKRVGGESIDEQILNMSEDYKKAFYDGFIQGRDTQRKADIQVVERLLREKV